MAYRHRETISFHPVVRALYLVLLGVLFWTALQPKARTSDLLVLALVGTILLAIPLVFGRLVIEVDEDAFRATWGFLGWPKTIIPLRIIEKSEPITYKPLRQFGGWGIRCGRIDGQLTAAYTLRGNCGLLLSLSQEIKANLVRTRRFLVGTQEPERLQQALGL